MSSTEHAAGADEQVVCTRQWTSAGNAVDRAQVDRSNGGCARRPLQIRAGYAQRRHDLIDRAVLSVGYNQDELLCV
jgi:hypothetical protein